MFIIMNILLQNVDYIIRLHVTYVLSHVVSPTPFAVWFGVVANVQIQL